MWKLVVVMCVLGNPCVIMEEDPIKHYSIQSECLANASTKHYEILQSFADFGYIIEKSDFTCEQDPNVL